MGQEYSTAAPPKPPEGGEQQAPQTEQQVQQDSQQQNERQLPRALVIVGPSGVGKNALISRITAGSDSFGHSVSHTTRAPRAGERVCVFVDGGFCGELGGAGLGAGVPSLSHLLLHPSAHPLTPPSMTTHTSHTARGALLLHHQGAVCQGDCRGQVHRVC